MLESGEDWTEIAKEAIKENDDEEYNKDEGDEQQAVLTEEDIKPMEAELEELEAVI